jgi:30S ribosomal protein S31
MGKGDLRTKRGKIFRGTYGNTRLKQKRRKKVAAAEVAKPAKPGQR